MSAYLRIAAAEARQNEGAEAHWTKALLKRSSIPTKVRWDSCDVRFRPTQML